MPLCTSFYGKDKSSRNLEAEQFQLKSNEFYIHPEYNSSAQNFDVCLIKTSGVDEIHYDLSKNFEAIPCLPKKMDLEKVENISHLFFHKPWKWFFLY